MIANKSEENVYAAVDTSLFAQQCVGIGVTLLVRLNVCMGVFTSPIILCPIYSDNDSRSDCADYETSNDIRPVVDSGCYARCSDQECNECDDGGILT